MYADDTILIAADKNSLQKCLDDFFTYCKTWKLNINVDKTKVLIFGVRNTIHFNFNIGGNSLEILDCYKYLGIYFTKSCSFNKTRKSLVEQAEKALHFLYTRISNIDLPVDLILKLFDHTIVPILTYNCEVWGYENSDIIEQVHSSFLRYITKVRKSTPLFMLRAELGRYPLSIIIKS